MLRFTAYLKHLLIAAISREIDNMARQIGFLIFRSIIIFLPYALGKMRRVFCALVFPGDFLLRHRPLGPHFQRPAISWLVTWEL